MSSAGWGDAPARRGGHARLFGLWQLLAGTSRCAELAARGQATVGDGSGKSLVRALDVRLRRTSSGQRLSAWLAGAALKLMPIEYLGLIAMATLVGWLLLATLFAPWLALVVALGASIGVSRAYIERKRGNRRDAFVAQLRRGRADALQRHVGRALDAAGDPDGVARARRPGGRRAQARGRGDAGRALDRGLAGGAPGAAAVARGRGPDDHDHHPTARGRGHRARARRAGRDARRAQGPAARDHHAAVRRRVHVLRGGRHRRGHDPARQRHLAGRDEGDRPPPRSASPASSSRACCGRSRSS